MKQFNHSKQAQRSRLLAWLRENPISTLECRKVLDILAPAARIFELRHNEGYNIVTQKIEAENIDNFGKHTVALYVLQAGTFKTKGDTVRPSLPQVHSQLAIENFKLVYDRINSNLTANTTQSEVVKRVDYFAIEAINDSEILYTEISNKEAL